MRLLPFSINTEFIFAKPDTCNQRPLKRDVKGQLVTSTVNTVEGSRPTALYTLLTGPNAYTRADTAPTSTEATTAVTATIPSVSAPSSNPIPAPTQTSTAMDTTPAAQVPTPTTRATGNSSSGLMDNGLPNIAVEDGIYSFTTCPCSV